MRFGKPNITANRQEEIEMKNAKVLNLKNMKETIVNY